ncbi:MAG: chromosome segregation protein SMC [Desulfobacterales bacterium]|nr:chromosome segregation protein SMC [Desulfobacterales bacterium]
MQLKKLEIYGFKSFADKCTIHFPPGVSAVVGPNGCGKSNVIDAIKWVMGEQSVRQLRGKAMGDVIFSGTDKKAPVNMAEVSLTLADISEHAPSPVSAYSEIMITRRLYRSGESAYLINKQPCRLKDIHDIFLRYGMGTRSCAIIQQGNIGAITDATAEERRSFIEEAAGVVRYKTRRQEAISKVNATRENLTRINDVLEEIESQLETLSEQAEKARRYKDRRQRLKQAEIRIAVYYYEDYARRIEENEKLLERLREKDTFSAEALEELNAALSDIDSRRRAKEAEISKLQAQKSEKQRNTDKAENELKHLADEQSRLEEEITGLKQSLEEVEAKNKKIASEIEEGTEKTRELQSGIDDIESQLAEQKSASEEDQQQLAELKEALEQQKKRQMELSAQRAKYQNIYQNAAANKDHVKRRLKQVESDKAETENNIAELTETRHSQQDKQEKLRQTNDWLAEEIQRCREAVKSERQELNAQIKHVNELSNERAKYKSKLSVLNRMQSNFEWYKDGVRAVMKARKEPELAGAAGGPGCMEIIADLIEPEPGYEQAAEAALGETLQYIVVSDCTAGMGAVDYLKKNSAGRSGFVPINMSARPRADSGGNGRISPIRNHIRVREGFEVVIDALIGDVGVAEDLQTARSALDSENTFSRVVTQNGDMTDCSGITTGGSADRLAGILEKKQEIRQVQHSLNEVDENLRTARQQQEALESAVRDYENELAAHTEKKHKNDAELLEAEKTLYKTDEKLKQARRHLEVVTLEQERLQGEKEDISDEIAEHDNALSGISEEIESLEADIEARNQQIETLNEKIKAFENRQMDLKLQFTKRSAELDNARQTVDRLKEYRDEGAGKVEQIQKDMDRKQKQADQARHRMDEMKKGLEAEKGELQSLREKLKSEQSDHQALASRQQETDKSISSTQSELEQTREKIHQIELDLSGLRINQENLVNRFLEKYADSFDQVRAACRDQVFAADFSIEKEESERAALKQKIDHMGEVNLGAIEAHETQKNRYDFLAGHRDDLEEALGDLENVIHRINRITRKLFVETFDAINEKFAELFPKLFNGGAAWLELTQPDKPLETGVELMIHPPGKKVSRLSLLSGGEKALSAIAFIFAIFLLNPAAFCLLDEIDAPLDDINVERFNELLKIIGENTQIIMITHNKKTMEFSDMLFGITMAGSGVSRLISVNIEEAMKINAQNADADPGKGTDHASALI